MATVQRASMIQYPDGQVVIHNIRKKRVSIPIFGANESYSATLVNTWYDGTTMDDSKADGSIYFKLKALPSGADSSLEQYVGSYFRLNLPKDGELFLEKPNVASLRNMSSTEILLLRMGYYKGVTLLGYYAENGGDTPAPIEYLLSDTAEVDDGGSVFEVGDIKLEHEFGGYIHVSYYGVVGDGVTDNSLFYSNIVKAAINHSTIEWYPNKLYVGNLYSEKPLNLIGNNSTIINGDGSENGFYFRGNVVEQAYNVTGPVSYGDDTIKVNTTDGISVDDIISISDDKLRPSNNLRINYETLLVKEVVDSTTIKVHDIIRSEQNTGNIYLDIIKPINGIRITDFNFESNDAHTQHQIYVVGARNVNVNNITSKNVARSSIALRYCFDQTVNNFKSFTPRITEGGEGYGVFLNRCRNGYLTNLTGYGMRHTWDLSATYTVTVKDTYDYGSFLPNMIAHNSFGGNVYIENVYTDGNNQASVLLSGQGIGENVIHIFRDLTIKNVTHVISDLTNYSSNIGSVRLESPLRDSSIDGVETVIVNPLLYSLGDRVTDSVVRIINTSINGFISVKNIRSNKISRLITITASNDSGNLGLLELDNLSTDSSNSIALLQGVRRAKIGNIDCDGALPASTGLFSISAGSLSEYTFFGIINKSVTNKIFEQVPTLLINGVKYLNSRANEMSITASAGMSLSREDLDSRTHVNISFISTSNLTLTSPNFLPPPIFKNEEFTLIVNSISDKGTYRSLLVPSTNTNIVNSQGNFGVTLRTGHTYKFKSGYLDGNKVWFVSNEDITVSVPLANISAENLVEISTANAVDEASVITLSNSIKEYINQYIVPLVNEIKSNQNTDLATQRNAGQRSV